jgi:hypothetical protein
MSAMRSSAVWCAVVSASVHYIRSERGRCLIRGRRPHAGVNKRWKTEPEAQRNGTRTEWNQEGIGGPTVAYSNGEKNEHAKFLERLRGRAAGCRLSASAPQFREEWVSGLCCSLTD